MKRNSANQVEIDEILKVLPHRQPFVFLDRVLTWIENSDPKNRTGQKIIALKNVSYAEPYFSGHFPHRPVMPGVLIIEALAQAGALACYKKSLPPMDVAIGRIGEARIRRAVVPGDQLILTAEVIKDRGSTVVVNCVAKVAEEIVTEYELLAYIGERKTHVDS